MGQVLLVRHGQASWGADDYDVLSPLGEQQAGVVGRALADLRPDVVVHGTLSRQRDTARVARAAAGWSAELGVDERWNEMDHVAVLARQPASFAADKPDPREFQEWFEQATGRWRSGDHDHDYDETFPQFLDRASAALDAVVGAVGVEGTGVVFTSGGTISAICMRLLAAGMPTYDVLTRVVANTSVTKLVVGRRGASLVSFNEHAHIPPDLLTYR